MPCLTSWALRQESTPLTCHLSWPNSQSQMVPEEPSRPPQRRLLPLRRAPRARMVPKCPLPLHQGALDFSSPKGRRGLKGGGGKKRRKRRRRGATVGLLAVKFGANYWVKSYVDT